MNKAIAYIQSLSKQDLKQLILYGLIGAFSSTLDFLVYILLDYLGLIYLIANCVSVTCGITTSFLLNRKYNFKVKDNTSRRFAIFLTVGLTGMALSNLLLFIFVNQFDVNAITAKLMSILPVVFLQFIINKTVTFRKQNNNNQKCHE